MCPGTSSFVILMLLFLEEHSVCHPSCVALNLAMRTSSGWPDAYVMQQASVSDANNNVLNIFCLFIE